MGKAGRGGARRAQAARQDREHGRLRPGVAQPAAGVLPAREPETAPAERAARAPCARRGRLPRRREGRGKLARAILRHAFSRRRRDGGDPEAARFRRHRGLASDDRRKPCGGSRLQANSEAGGEMKGLLWRLVLSALAVALSLAMRGHGAYALFVLHPWRAEISLNLLAILLIVVLAAAYFLLRVVWHALRLPLHVRAFRERRRAEKGHAAALGAIQALFEGQFGRAEKLASGAAELGATPGLASLLAARAAQRLRQFGRRDQWLERAKEGDGEWRLARLMTAAELLLEERRFLEARAVLRELNAGRPRHVAALLLSLRAEQGMANWDDVLRVANLLEKRDAMPPEALDSVRVNARVAILSRKAADRESLARHWEDTPRSERLRPKIAAAAARAFIELGDCRKAHRIIEEALENDWDGALALLYGECTDEDAFERLERAERWLRERPGEAELLLTLGRLCVQRELWGKAQSYLEASLSTQAAHVALARLFERIGRTEEANRHFRASADLGSAPRALD